jgi:hypothetical protein
LDLANSLNDEPLPASAVVEDLIHDTKGGRSAWLKEMLGLPPDSSFTYLSGRQMAHATCLAAARHELPASCGWDVETQGMAGLPLPSCKPVTLTNTGSFGPFESLIPIARHAFR